MAVPESFTVKLIVYSIATFWGIVTLFSMIYTMFTVGIKGFFSTKNRTDRPKCMDDSSLGIHSFIGLKKVKLHYVTNGPKSKPLMLFLHGFPECWYSWRYQLREFSKKYRTVALDMRGYGESGKPKGIDKYTLDELIHDVKAFIEALGYEKCVLVGHDWGGIVAIGVTQRYRDIVTKLVLMNTVHLRAFQDHIQQSWKQMFKSWYIFMFQLPFLPEIWLQNYDYCRIDKLFSSKVAGAKKSACDPDDVDAYKYAISLAGGLTSSINYYRALLGFERPNYARWEVMAPTLMIWGEQDRVLDKELARKSCQYIPDSIVIYVKTSSHWVQMEAPEEVNLHMRNFLSGKKAF